MAAASDVRNFLNSAVAFQLKKLFNAERIADAIALRCAAPLGRLCFYRFDGPRLLRLTDRSLTRLICCREPDQEAKCPFSSALNLPSTRT